jgi:hypothetical protein
MKLATATRTALAAALLADFDDGTGPCTLQFYTGAQPANVATGATGTLLGTLTCSDPVGTSGSGALTFDAITQDSAADATGTAGYARLFNGSGTAKADFSVGTSGADIILNTLSIVAGGPIQVTSFVITIGGA